ncbi:uncharacterized protein CANTADRAFT_48984 [Suhomyces tanzawaensis NRRL Y-17324]|uniref:CWH43-like N-terminal domain-containing protein n=1 Tax=Suhomyces tanzawaensis NRRL Y-17324 TaxID=984487 RepID=A0A1E4SKU0_9ASCO|nr:uncharacterized protein CANTADRAFT_48984 [Suhomyces tanzawaensis NRRL Y-17324]ODV80135.1 hypothetical protein CANTADRAFT_48984 [Suhomyces tanzawaensis NRRL Y-17324]
MISSIKSAFINLTSKFNHFYCVPLFGLVCWYGLLFGLVGSWVAKGAKAYPKYGESAVPLPLERIGVILEPVFFVVFAFIHAIVFCVSMYLEFYHRKIGKLIKFIKPTLQKRLAFASITIGIIAQVFFVTQSLVYSVYMHKYSRAHSHYAVLLAIFAILIMISLALNFINYYIMGQYYAKYVNGEKWNKFTISFILKITWLIVTISVAVICCIFYVKKKKAISSVFEWIFHFWYGLLLAFWTYDLYPLTELRALRKQGTETPPLKQEKVSVIRQKFKNWSPTKSKNSDLEKNSPTFTYITPVGSAVSSQENSSRATQESPTPFGFNGPNLPFSHF